MNSIHIHPQGAPGPYVRTHARTHCRMIPISPRGVAKNARHFHGAVRVRACVQLSQRRRGTRYTSDSGRRGIFACCVARNLYSIKKHEFSPPPLSLFVSLSLFFPLSLVDLSSGPISQSVWYDDHRLIKIERDFFREFREPRVLYIEIN